MALPVRPFSAAMPPPVEAAGRRNQADPEADSRHRLDDQGAGFYRRILEGAFERVYRPDGGYRLREIGSGSFIEDLDGAGRPKAKAVAE